MKEEIKFYEACEYLEYFRIATELEIHLVCCINGHSLESLKSILYARTGYRSFEQHEEAANS